MHDYLIPNMQIVRDRWPEIYARLVAISELDDIHFIDGGLVPTLLVHGIHISSCFDRQSEARLQADSVPESSMTAWVYGVGCGDLQCELLGRSRLQKLDVMVLSLGLLKGALKFFDHRQWLGDPRTRLHIAAERGDIRMPFSVVPACLKIVDDEARRLRDLIVLELESRYINTKVRSNPQFLKQIRDNAALVDADHDVEELFKGRSEKLFYVAAAGPTLSEHYERLKNRDKNTTLIAVDASVKPLVLQGIVPDIVVSIDGVRDHILALLDVNLSLFESVPLVYFPIVHKDVLQRWPGPRYAALSNSPLYEDLLVKHPKGILFSSGTVLHAAVDLAVKMGGCRICLMGADFSFPGGRSHVDNAVFCQSVEPSPACSEMVVNGNGQQVLTAKNFRGYLRDLERYIVQHPQVKFINGSRNGALISGTTYLDSI